MFSVGKKATTPGGELLRLFDPVAPANLAERLRPAMFLVFLGILIVLFLMPLFTAPFERDQGAYATVARGWMGGSLPYLGLWDNKGPLLFLWYAVSFSLLGQNLAAPRIAAALAAGLSVPFLWAATKSLFGRCEAAVAAIIFALSFSNLYLQVNANSEVFMLLPMTIGFWAFAIGVRKNRTVWFLLSGIFTSLAVFTRQSAILAFLGYTAWLTMICLQTRENRSGWIRALFALISGGVLGALPFVIYFAIHGALYDLWYAMFGFNTGWVAEQSFWLKFVPPLFIEPGPLAGGLVFWIAAGVGCWELWKRKDSSSCLVLFFLAASEIAAQIMGKGSAHYSIQLLPGAAIAAVFGFPRIVGYWKNGGRTLRTLLASAGAITLGALLFAYAKPNAESRFMVQYTFRDYAQNAVDAPAIAKVVAAKSSPGECVYEWGRSSQIYFLADRRPCSRWFYDRSYKSNASMISEVVSDLRKRNPRIIMVTGEILPPPELSKLINEDYCYIGQVNYAKLYKPLHDVLTINNSGRSYSSERWQGP